MTRQNVTKAINKEYKKDKSTKFRQKFTWFINNVLVTPKELS